MERQLTDAACVLRWRSQVFTFDDYGVSGHPNHIATHFGVQQALGEQLEKCSAATTPNAGAEKVVRGWALESTNIVRKYIGILDTVPSLWLTRPSEDAQQDRQFVFVFRPWWNYNAMALHQSQFVWYRRLFVVFSRYTYVNTFRPLLEVDVTDRSSAHKKTQWRRSHSSTRHMFATSFVAAKLFVDITGNACISCRRSPLA